MAEPFQVFLSYSRNASGQLAIDLQNGLERFAKPWYRLRALRVFRDDASMSANTALWSTIQTGLSQAQFFVLVATPAAAASTYVAQEIQWWLQHKGPANLLIVQADGEIYWDRQRGCFHPASTAVPPILHHAYPEEPRWIDLRWYAQNPDVARSDPRFAERLADLAATVRGLDRDLLVGENVRQHRRALRLARGAVVTLAVLLVLSIVAGLVAVGQRRDAITQRNEAQTQATIARARQLAATSRTLLDTDIVQSRLLAVQAYRLHADEQTEAALLEAVTAAPHLVRNFTAPGTVFDVTAAADVSRLYATTREGTVVSWDRDGRLSTLGSVDQLPLGLDVSADGAVVAAVSSPALRIWIDGEVAVLPRGVGQNNSSVAVSPSGATVAVAGVAAGGIEVRVLRRQGSALAMQATVSLNRPVISALELPSDDEVVAWVGSKDTGDVEHYALPSGRLAAAGRGGFSSARDTPGGLSADGRHVGLPQTGGEAGRMAIFRTDHDYTDMDATPDRLGFVTGSGQGFGVLSPDASRSAYATAGAVYVAATTQPDVRPTPSAVLRGTGDVFTMQFAGNRHLLTGSRSSVQLWDLEQESLLSTTQRSTVPTVPRVAPAPRIVPSGGGSHVAITGWRTGVTLLSTRNGAVLLDRPESVFLAWRDENSFYYADAADQRIRLHDLILGRIVSEFGFSWPTAPNSSQLDITSATYVAADDQLIVAGGGQIVTYAAATGATETTRTGLTYPSVSTDGRYGFGVRDGREPVVVELSTGEIRIVPIAVEVDPVLAEQAGLISGYEGNVLVTFSGADRIRTFWSPDGRHRLGTGPNAFDPAPRISVSLDGHRYAARRADDSLAVVDLASGSPIGTFNVAHSEGKYSYAFSGDGRRLLVAVPRPSTTANPENTTGLLMSITLDPRAWIDASCASAGRDLTPDEWSTITGTAAPADLRCAG
jgi:WD40 repeat protein